MRARRVLVALGAILVLAAVGPASGAERAPTARTAAIPGGDWTQFDYDAQRSGVGPAGTGINASNLHRLRRQTVHLDGTVDSSAIELHAIRVTGRVRDVIVVTTAYGRTIAIDPQTGRHLWEFTPSDIARFAGSPQITTSTPIFDPDRRYVYSASPDGLVHKLVLANGRQVRSRYWPAKVTFLPRFEKLGTALNIDGPSLIVTTGGYDGDAPPYQGHVVLIDRASGRITHVFNSLCSDRHRLIRSPSSCPADDSAIWSRAGSIVEPGSGDILVATGNGPFDGIVNWGDSVLRLSPTLRLLSNWTPRNQSLLDGSDLDLGSTSPALLPGGLAVQGGKLGILSLLNVGRLNGKSSTAGPTLGGELQRISEPGGSVVLTQPAVWGSYVFVANDSSTTAYVLGGGRLHVGWRDGTSGTSPVIAGGLLYVYDQQGGNLNVYVPQSGHLLDSLPAAGGHWNSPIVVGGRIILPTGDYHDHAASGELFIYHLPGR